MAQLKHAQIVVLEGERKTIEAMYNPETVSLGTRVDSSGWGATLQFDKRACDDFVVELFFDTYETGSDVRLKTRPLVDLTKPTIGTKGRRRPPQCLFQWGGIKFTGMVQHVQENFTLFLSSGTPVRERVTLTLTQTLTVQQDEADQGLPNCPRAYLVSMGDRLDAIANRTLEDPELWRVIAEANDIADPLQYPSAADYGARLAIPDVWGHHAKSPGAGDGSP
jgi:hypothetical protein